MGLLAEPADLLLVALHRCRLSDLDPPAPILLLPELGYDAKAHQRVVEVLRQAL